MKKISVLDRTLLLGTCLLAAFEISVGLDGLPAATTWGLTVGFGTLLVACLLLIILGFEGLERQAVVIVSTVIPLGISLGMVSYHYPDFQVPYLVFCAVGFGLIAVTRYASTAKPAAVILALVHGIAGLVITLLPLSEVLVGRAQPGYALVGVGGALIGLGGLLLTGLRTGKPLLSQEKILSVLPALLLLMAAAFIGGFSFL